MRYIKNSFVSYRKFPTLSVLQEGEKEEWELQPNRAVDQAGLTVNRDLFCFCLIGREK
jgi:hypothetical protein